MSEPRGGYAIELWLSEDATSGQMQEQAVRNLGTALASERARGREVLTVEVHGRTAQLAGVVGSWGEKLAARHAVMRVPGLEAVDDSAITVDPPASELSSDAQLAGRARSILDWSWRVPRGAVQVDAADGRITLSGTVDHDDERTAAMDAVSGLAGVREVNNDILVPPRPRLLHTIQLIEEELAAALGRDARHVRVTLSEIGARITGRLATLASRSAAERAVRRVLGDVPLSWRLH